jgi:hypothetical protein
VAAVGNGETFARGRDLAAWLGLVPRQITTGGKPRLVGITKRGNKYLRKLLIHGARSVLPGLAAGATPLGGWLRGLLKRMHKNAAVVALANKLAFRSKSTISLLRRNGCGMLSRRPATSSACRLVRRLERRSSWRMWRMVRRTLRVSRTGCVE